MSVDGYAEAAGAPVAAARGRGPGVSAAGFLSGAMVVSGLLTYAFLVLAARSLGPAAYGQVGALWAAMFIAAIILFRPLEQTASRSIADRRARGEEVRSVVRSVVWLSATILVGVSAVGSAFSSTIAGRLFGGDETLTAMLLAGIACYGLSYVIRGLVGGLLWFNGYGINLIADGLGRLALALPLLAVASVGVAGGAVAGAGLVGALVPLAIGRRRLRPLLARGAGAHFRRRAAVRFALPAATIAASDQLLVNGAPLLVMAGGGAYAAKAAGLAFAATMLVRAPVFVFQGVAAALLPTLTQVNATVGVHAIGADLKRAARPLTAVGAILVAACWLGGPLGMRILYGNEYSASRSVFAALGIGVALYLAAATLSQALLAIDAGARAAAAWAVAAATLAVSYAILPGDALIRVASSFALAALVLLLALGALVYRSARVATRPQSAEGELDDVRPDDVLTRPTASRSRRSTEYASSS